MHGGGDPLAFWRGLMWAVPISLAMWTGLIMGARALLAG